MLADLLESCGDEPRGEISATDLKERYGLTDDALVEQVNLLNLVNFGGGCYAVYAEFDGDTIKVEKELYGEEFRRPARLSPLEAKAILMALDLVGPQVAARRGHHARRRAAQGRVGVRRASRSARRRRRSPSARPRASCRPSTTRSATAGWSASSTSGAAAPT